MPDFTKLEASLRTQQAECKVFLAEKQEAMDARFGDIGKSLAAQLKEASRQSIDIEEISQRKVTFGKTEDVAIPGRDANAFDSDVLEEEEQEEEDEELSELFDDPDYQDFLRAGGVHEEANVEDLEGYE